MAHSVTAVGGTVHIPEVAASFSGGGFSDYFERPNWQNRAVQSFLESLPKGAYAGLFNPAGRVCLPLCESLPCFPC
ncbi:hypothetical protein EDB89DRAFT_2104352 [Lactarius sanguifluus]|nr:hypothetical protein EDB89DRAFT_2104352 [Lactarius sanguifluus]